MPQDKMVYRLAKRRYPYVPVFEGFGPGCAVEWPNFFMLEVGYTKVPGCPGNLEVKNPGKHGHPDGGKWEIVTVWGNGWMAIRSLISDRLIFSVPPGTLVPIKEGESDA